MNDKHFTQIISWLVWSIAIPIGIFLSWYGGAAFVLFSSIATRKGLNETKFNKSFQKNNWLFLSTAAIVMLYLTLQIIAGALFDEPPKTFKTIEYFRPFLAMIPVLIYYEYKLYKYNA